MRAIVALSLCLLPLISAAADLVRYEPQPGSSWVGYFDPATRLFSGAKPAFILTVPETAAPTPYKPGSAETPAELKARGEALAKLGAKLRADAQKMGKHVEDQRSIAEHGAACEKEASKIIAQASDLLAAIKASDDSGEKEKPAEPKTAHSGIPRNIDAALDSLAQATSAVTEAQKQLDEASKSATASRKAFAQAMSNYFNSAGVDLKPVTVQVSIGTPEARQVQSEVERLNLWLQRFDRSERRGNVSIVELFARGTDELSLYAKYKKVPWIQTVSDRLRELGR